MRARALFEHPTGSDDADLWFSADGGALVVREAQDGWLFDLSRAQLVARGASVPRGRHAFSRDGALVALGGDTLRVVQVRTGAAWTPGDAWRKGAFVDVALSPDATLVAAATSGGRVALLELPGGGCRAVLGGYTTRDRWSCETTESCPRFRGDGARLLTLGATVEAWWGVATHHGLPDEEYAREDTLTVWDVTTGARVAATHDPRSRFSPTTRTADFVAGGELVLTSEDGGAFRVLGPDLDPLAHELTDARFRSVHATPDGARVITVDDDGLATLWTLPDPSGAPATCEGEGDPFNAFGLPTVVGEAPPRFRVRAAAEGVRVTSWPEGEEVARIPRRFARLAVQPWSLGGAFATLGGGRVTLWRLEG